MLAAIGSFVCLGVSDFLGPLLTRRTPVLSVIVFGHAGPAVLLGLAVGLFSRPFPGVGFLALGLVAGVLTAVATALAFRAGQIGHIGLVAVILSLCAVIPVVAGVVGGDRPPVLQWAGIVLAACGTGLTLLGGGRLVRHEEGGGRVVDDERVPLPGAPMPIGAAAVPARPPKVVAEALRRAGNHWPLLAACGAVGFGIYLVVLADLAADDLIWATFLSRAGMVITAAVAIMAFSQPLFAPGSVAKQVKPLPLLGTIMTAGILLFGYAAVTMLTVASSLTAFAPVVAVALGWIFLKERLARPQIVGIAITVGGLLLIAL